MKIINKYSISLVLMFVLALACSSLYAESFSGKTYYTRTNIWYENPNDILSTNYHRGTILPIGTKVSIHKLINRRIQFTPEGSAQMFTIINDKKTNTISIDELFNRYFSIEAVQTGVGDYYQTSEADRENINKGVITLGMSRKAVLMAYGYPPTHKTPLLTSDIWHYWYARLHKVTVFFKDDKIFKIETIEPASYPGFIKSNVDSTGGKKSGNKTKE
ncbi:MAG: hypothetical protein BWK74_03080 [Desulfobacteraceae bacterium A6]|nr:MAG: hypothetical protein BWK74_03080 [Desulfobacteraceae bacterium A6]